MKNDINQEMIDGLSAAFPLSKAPATSWGNVISNHLLLRNLRGYWPFTSVDENGDLYDLSGQGRVLTNNNAVPFASVGLSTYADFTPGSNHYFSRPREAGLDIIGAITFGCWVWLDTLAPGSNEGIIGKWNDSGGANQRSYVLWFEDAVNQFNVSFSSLGTGASSLALRHTTIPTAGAWYHVVGRLIPGVRQSIFVNGLEVFTLVGVPAAIFNSNATFEIGSTSAGTLRLDGKIQHSFLVADALEDYFIKALYWHSCPLLGVKP